MTVLAYLIGLVLPPITLAVFAGGLIFRFREWWKLPAPKVTMYPAPEPGAETFVSVLKSTFFFPRLFKSDKGLWTGAWVFHAMLALILVGHVRVLTDFPWLWKALGLNADVMSNTMGGLAGIVILLTLLFLLARRMSIPRVREITQGGDWLALALLLLIVLTGDAMRFFGHFDLNLSRAYFAALVTLQFQPAPANGWFLLHFLLGQCLFLYLPFSKMLHFGGVFFTQTALQRR